MLYILKCILSVVWDSIINDFLKPNKYYYNERWMVMPPMNTVKYEDYENGGSDDEL